MGLIAKEGGITREPIPEDVHHAVCYAIYDLGTHYDDKYKKKNHKCVFLWEFPEVRTTINIDGKDIDVPRIISRQYTVSLSPKANLRIDLGTWRGRSFTALELEGFVLKNVLGANCLIQIIHETTDGKIKQKISSILPLPKSMKAVKPENELAYFDLDVDDTIPDMAPTWVREMIMESEEIVSRNQVPTDFEEVPF